MDSLGFSPHSLVSQVSKTARPGAPGSLREAALFRDETFQPASRLSTEIQASSHLGEASVAGPQPGSCERCRCQQMSVDPADSPAHKAMALNKGQHLVVAAYRHTRQSLKQHQHFRAATQPAACQLADNEWVAFHFFVAEQDAERRIAPPEMVNPDGSINQHERACCAAVVGVGGFAGCLAHFHPVPPIAERSPERSGPPDPLGRSQSSRQCH